MTEPAQGVYLTGCEPASGKSAVALGLQQLLARRIRRLGVFRPVVNAQGDDDGLLELLRSRGASAAAPGVGVDLVRADEPRALAEIVARHHALAAGCDAVLAVGTDFAGVGTADELAFNARVALNLGLPALCVVSGHDRRAQEVLSAVSVALATMEAARCEVAAVVVNRVRAEELEAVTAALPYGAAYVLPEVQLLMAPTVGQIAETCAGELLAGDPAPLSLFEARVDGEALLERLSVACPRAVTPLMFEFELLDRARAQRRRIVMPEADDERILRAAETLLLRNVVDLTLLGDENAVRAAATRFGADVAAADVVDPADPELAERFAEEYARRRASKGVTLDAARDVVAQPSYFGTLMVLLGMADGMVSGATHTTAETIRPSLELVKTRPGSVEGPIQYDAAVDASVAHAKLPGSAVAGRASVFVFPDLNTGNNTYKAVQRSGGAVAVGPVLQGLNKPVNDLSRGATARGIVNTVAITAIQAQP